MAVNHSTIAAQQFMQRFYRELHNIATRHRTHKSYSFYNVEGLDAAQQVMRHVLPSFSGPGAGDGTVPGAGCLCEALFQACSFATANEPQVNQQPRRHQNRYTDFAWENGLVLLSLCAWSPAFRHSCLVDEDDEWQEISQLIGSRARSVELFATVRGLNWKPLLEPFMALPTAAATDLVQSMDLSVDHPHHWYLALDGSVRRPLWKGCLQRHADDVVFNASAWSVTAGQDLTLRSVIDYGPCNLCGSTLVCGCSLSPSNEPLVELVEYAGRGIGVQALSPITAGVIVGQFMGELIPLSSETDEVWSLVQYYGRSEIAVLSPPFLGNWTRYLNHSCDASTEFIDMVVGKRLVMAVRARRNIQMFEEITVDYGETYWRSKPHQCCLCGSEQCEFGLHSRQ